jgi:hypothetical protein
MRRLAADLHATGQLRPDLTIDEAADIILGYQQLRALRHSSPSNATDHPTTTNDGSPTPGNALLLAP